MQSYIDSIKTTDRNGNKAILYPETKQDAVFGLNERLAKLEIADITTTTDKSMPNSHKGRLMFEEIGGVSEQGENPSPDNPQEIYTVKGKNLLDCRGLTEQIKNGGTFTPVYDDNGNLLYINVNGTFTAQTDYVINSGMTFGNTEDYIFNTQANGSDVTIFAFVSTDGHLVQCNDTEVKFTPLSKSTVYTCHIRVRANQTISNLKFYPMIRPDSVSDDAYVPYGLLRVKTHDGNGAESSITLSTPIELCGIGDVQDVIDVENGLVRKRIKKVVFDGSEDEGWTKSATMETSRYYVFLNDIFASTDCDFLCSQARKISDTTSTEKDVAFVTPANQFAINADFSTIDEWKAHLQANPMTVIYELATEEVPDLPTADRIALNSLLTYDGVTYLEWDCYLEPTHKGKYGTSEVGGYTLEGLLTGRNAELLQQINAERITALETALINNV